MPKNLKKLIIIILFSIIFNLGIIFVNTEPRKIFVVTGETSAEQIGGWYLSRLKKDAPEIKCEAIGGKNLEKEGAKIYDNYKKLVLGFVGPIQFIKKLQDRWYYLKDLSKYILENNFDEVILIDCPLTNMTLMRILKKSSPEIKITYIAPPEMWLWGKWGLGYFFKNYSDKTIVVYPFEVDWYKKEGLEVEFLGWPGYEKIKPYASLEVIKKNKIALCPGSRKSEIEVMLPIFLKVSQIIVKKYPEISFILPISECISKQKIENEIKKYSLRNKIEIINDDNLFEELNSCCLAISKPGTITLILALLKVPTIIAIKLPLITYFILKMIFQKSYVGLPNLFLDKEIFKELIQDKCTIKNITEEIENLYEDFKRNQESYKKRLKELEKIQEMLIVNR